MKPILHKRKPGTEPQPVFMVGDKVLTYQEAVEIFCQVEKYNRLLDVMSYAENGYGLCDDPAIARKVQHYAVDITKAYEDMLEWNEAWFDVLEDIVARYMEGLR